VETSVKTMTRTILSAIVLAGLAVATPAFATGFDVNFVITIDSGPDAGTYTFSLPDSPTVNSTGSDDFTVANVEISKNGGAAVSETAFFTEDQNPPGYGDGGVAVFSGGPYIFNLVNPNQIGYSALFTGSLTDPSFVGGVYDVEDDGNTADKGTVTIYTPEPRTLVLFGMGLLCLAGAMRRKLPALRRGA